MFQTLKQTRTQIEADLLISRLRASGLHPSDLRVWPHVTLAGAELFFSVQVPEEEWESAVEIVGGPDPEGTVNARSATKTLTLVVMLVLATLALGMLMP